MAEQEIVIYDHPNREMKSFLTQVELSPPRLEHFKKPLDTESQAILAQLGLIGSQLVKEIMALPGVMSLRIKPKEIMVKKEVSASWEDIQDKILLILRRSLRKKGMKIVRQGRE